MGHSYRDLLAWQKARRLATEVYRATDCFPRSEMFGIRSQLRRATVSVASNIAEGQGRLGTGEFLQFLGHARGSLLELQTQLTIAFDLGFLLQDEFKRLDRSSGDVLGLINRLIESLQQSRSAKEKQAARS